MTSKNLGAKVAQLKGPADHPSNSRILGMKVPAFKGLKSRSPDRPRGSIKNSTVKSIKFSPDRSGMGRSLAPRLGHTWASTSTAPSTAAGKRPASAGQVAHHFTKLRIVSKDKVDVETKKTNYLPLTSKEPLAIACGPREPPTQPTVVEAQRPAST
jgi:hypothetical protein